MDAIQVIKQYWGHSGIRPVLIIERNKFGNLLVQDNSSRFWRICPEELTCEVIASNPKQMKQLWDEPEFKNDWDMTGFAVLAYNALGDVDDEQCYHFITPPALGGAYEVGNIGITTISELITDSGIQAEKK